MAFNRLVGQSVGRSVCRSVGTGGGKGAGTGGGGTRQHTARIGWGLGKSCSFRSLFCKSDVGPRLEAYFVKVAFGAWADLYFVKVAKIRRKFRKNGPIFFDFLIFFVKVASGNQVLIL